jgi:hypothetical protein
MMTMMMLAAEENGYLKILFLMIKMLMLAADENDNL